MLHTLKIHPEYFAPVKSGAKTFEIRKADRNYKVGDSIMLEEYDPEALKMGKLGYTGNVCHKRISYVFRGGKHGVSNDYVVLGLTKF